MRITYYNIAKTNHLTTSLLFQGTTLFNNYESSK